MVDAFGAECLLGLWDASCGSRECLHEVVYKTVKGFVKLSKSLVLGI
jgi:hypothetical protein